MVDGSDPTNNASGKRHRRERSNVRELLLESAITEFALKGYDGASTTSIAKRADAFQPQINYHFKGKADLWRTAVDLLFDRLDEVLGEIDAGGPAENFDTLIRRLVYHNAAYPQLSQIVLQEATAPSERLEWITETHVRDRYESLAAAWTHLQGLGVAAPIHPRLVHYVLTGAITLPFVNAPEAGMLLGDYFHSDEMVQAHADGLVATLLPGYCGSS